VIRALVAYLPLGLWAAAVLYVGAAEVDTPSLPSGTDKVAHFLIYAVGGALAAWTGRKSRNRVEGLIGLGIVIVTGLIDEIHQIYLPHRNSDVMDWLADAAGAFIAYAVVRRLLKKG
jgi:VanZ family protein